MRRKISQKLVHGKKERLGELSKSHCEEKEKKVKLKRTKRALEITSSDPAYT